MIFKLKNKGLVLGWYYLWNYKRRFLKVLAISLGGAFLGSVVPLIFGELVQVAPDPKTSIWLFLKLVIAWAVLDQTYNWTNRYTQKHGTFVAWDASSDMFVASMQHLIKLPMSFLGRERLGKILQRLERSSDFMEQSIRDVIFSLFPHFVTMVLCLCFVLYINWVLLMLLLVTVIFYVLAMVSKTKLILSKTRETRRMWENCWGYMWDLVSNTRAIKSNTNEEFEMEKVKKTYGLPFEKEKIIEEIRGQLRTREHFIFGLGAVAVLSTGAYLLRLELIDAGNLISFLYYLNLVYKPFSQMSHNWRLVQQTTISLERTAKFMEVTEEDYDSGESQEIVGQVEFKNVTFSYETNGEARERTVLENINFKVEPGETIALVGQSGVGKTTLVDLIAKYFEPLEGAILIDGKDVRNWNLRSLRSQIAVVPQDVFLFNDTVQLNIGYGDLSQAQNLASVEGAARSAYAHEFITSRKFKDGYTTIVGEKGVKVSTGQRQRIAIARAFLRNSKIKILILDEVTSALDSESEKHIQKSLADLKKDKTTFIIAHRLSTIKNADKIVVLDQGGVAEIGKHEELIRNNGPYKRFVNLQSLDTVVV